MNERQGRFTHGSSILALISMVLVAFCPVCVFSMLIGAMSLGFGLFTQNILPILPGFVVVFSIPFSWRAYEWFRKGSFAKLRIPSFITLQLTIGTILFVLGVISKNLTIIASGYMICLMIPVLYKLRLKGYKKLAFIFLFVMVSLAFLGRMFVYSVSSQPDCGCGFKTSPNIGAAKVDEMKSDSSDNNLNLRIQIALDSGEPACLFFYADWCHFCQKEQPIIERLEARYEGKTVFIRLNEKNNSKAMEQFGVKGFPTMTIVLGKNSNGNYISATMHGYKEEQELVQILDAALSTRNKARVTPLSNVSSTQTNALTSEIEKPLNGGLAFVALVLPVVYLNRKEKWKTIADPKLWSVIFLSFIIVAPSFSSEVVPELMYPAAGGYYNAVDDPGFEAGTPWPSWQQYSTNFGTPICSEALCGACTPHSGTYLTWFGGIEAYELGWIRQTVIIPPSATTLKFWRMIPVCASSGADYLHVYIDGIMIFSETRTSPSCGDLVYQQKIINIASYANGGLHILEFRSETYGQGSIGHKITNFWVDDIAIEYYIAPTVTVLSPKNNTSYYKTYVPLNFTVDEQISYAGYSLDKKPEIDITQNTTWNGTYTNGYKKLENIVNGSHNITVFANATYGVQGSSDATNFLYCLADLTGPTMWVPDRKIDLRDLYNIAYNFGTLEGDGKYDARNDLNVDGKIDNSDLEVIANQYGKTC